MHTKIRFALFVLGMFAGSVLGGAITGYFVFQPKEACAACVGGTPVYACARETCTSGGNCTSTKYLSTVTACGAAVGYLIP